MRLLEILTYETFKDCLKEYQKLWSGNKNQIQMHALISSRTEEKVQVGIFNFVMISLCLKEMILLLLVLPGPILIKMSILNLVRKNMV